MSFVKINPETLSLNPFVKIGKEWMLVTAGDGERVNTMTASWGGLGVLWGADVATIYVRPQRYTYTFTQKQDRFTLSFFDGACKKELGVLGTVSGRDTDKIADVGFHVRAFDGAPALEEASLVLVCRTVYRDMIKEECFIDRKADEANYPKKDYHMMYIARIEAAYTRA